MFRIATAVRARCLVSDEIPSPVTFGWRDPVVLLPARFPSLRTDLREAILCHELIHVERHDWMFTVAEELVRAFFWLHPAIWWVLGEIQLAREQTVDQAVIEITHARGHYVDALLAMAQSPAAPEVSLDLSPAPLFLRRRHLKQRVFELLREVRVTPFSKLRLALIQASAMAAIAAACWLVSGAFPLAAAPQRVADDAGVVVNTGDAKLVHRTPVVYPPWALQNGIQGRVVIQARIDADGQAGDDSVVLCPRELCNAAIDSLATWQFDPGQANTMREIRIDFVSPASTPMHAATSADAADSASGWKTIDLIRTTPKPAPAPSLYAQTIMPVAPGLMATPTIAQAQRGVPTFVSRTFWFGRSEYVDLLQPASASALGHSLSDIRIAGLSDSAATQLKSRLPLQPGSVWSAATAGLVTQVVTGFDPHLEIDLIHSFRSQQWSLWIGPAFPLSSQTSIALPPLPPGVYMAGDGVMPPAVLSKVDPAYTDEAKNAGISGVVTLSVVVGGDGTPQDIQVVNPLDPGLDQAARDAVAKWRFRPGSKDSMPVNVQTQVNLSFRLL